MLLNKIKTLQHAFLSRVNVFLGRQHPIIFNMLYINSMKDILAKHNYYLDCHQY